MKHLSCGARRLLSVFLFLFAMASIQAQLVFSEVMAVNTDGEYNPVIGEPGDWIEIYNGTPYAVDLSGYYLSDDPDDPFKWKFPQKTYLNNGYYHLIWADGTNDTLHGSHTNFKLGSAGESLFLHNLQGELYDSLSYPMMFENVSFGISDDGSRVYFGVPTPGSRNDSSSGYLVTGGVEFEPPPALYPSALSVSLIPEIAGSTIRYTLDGSPPEPSDPVYTAPIPVTENTVIRARLWTEGYEPGRIATSTYILSEGFTLPVISLVTDPAHLFDDQTGIYVEGTNGIPGYCEEEPKNWNQDWERPMSMEYFDLNGSRQVQHDGGTKIHGGCSRQAPLKSLAFFARSKYGKNRIEYPFFSQKEADSFKGLIFRNSGNDYWYSFMRDAVMQAVVTPSMDLDDQAYEPVQLFLNGEYWGIHNLREKVNEHWVTSNYGIPDENLDFIKNRNEVFAGSYHAYSSLSYFLFNNSMAIEENYQQVANQVDIGSYMDYLITQMFFINRDWPGNNQKCWRDRVNGSKWRWILFDLDFGFGLYDFDPAFDMFSFSTTDTVDEWPNPAWSTLMIRKLLENDGYREEFIGKYMMHLNTTFNPDHVNHVIDSFYYRLVDIFPAHLDRWNRDAEGDWEFRTMEEWEYNVEELRLFARARPAYVWQNMRDFFSLGEQILLNVESSHGLGQILVNGVIMPQNGMNGHYAAGSDINLEFHAEPGYQLNHWEVTGLVASDTVLMSRNSSWKFNDSGIYPGDDWKTEGFDDTGWLEGSGELGYGDEGETTVLDFGGDPENKHISYYFRSSVEIDTPEYFDQYTIRLLRDDGAVVYVNGVEVMRDNLPAGDILSGTTALVFVGGEDESRYFEYSIEGHYFLPGTNLVAVEVHQQSPGSSDVSFDLELAASVLTAGDTTVYPGSALLLNPEEGIRVRAIAEEKTFDPDLELYINEFMASNQGAHQDEFGEDADWIEIYNAGSEDVDMAGLYVTDNLDNPLKWQIPYGSPYTTTVRANDFLVLYADGDIQQGPLHLNFKLGSAGEAIGLAALSGPDLFWIDSIRFGTQQPDISFGRFPDGSNDWEAMAEYTPWASNLITASRTAQAEEFHLEIYPNPASDRLNIRLSVQDGRLTGIAAWSIYDLTGRRILNDVIGESIADYSGSIGVSDLSAGIYILVVENGPATISRKFIKSGQ